MDDRKRAAIEFSLLWESRHAGHNDRLFIEKIDFWRDVLPGSLGEALAGSTMVESHAETFAPGTLVRPHAKANIITFKKSQLSAVSNPGKAAFKPGRFYPKSFFWRPLQSFPADQTPVRLIHVDDTK